MELRSDRGNKTPARAFASYAVVLACFFVLPLASAPAASATASGASSSGGSNPNGQQPLVVSIALDTTIDPVSADWIKQALKEAESDGAELVIVRLDTPGGLDTSMREIIQRILAAPLPVVVFVYPDGARAASAGVYITEAADVAAMAPQTNIGSATPITIGPGTQDEVLGRKIRNDAAAYVRALAQAHGRNPDLAEQMVRKATNVTAAEAKRAGLIDLVATGQPDLLRQLNGYRVKGPRTTTLNTTGAKIENRDRPFKYQLLGILVNPTTTYLLFILGLIGIGLEVFHPGAILPGALGAVSLILALFGLAELPLNVAGVLLILLAFVLFVAEAHITSHGGLGAGGVVALIAGGLLLFNTDSSAFGISAPVVIASGALLGGLFVFIISKAVQARHRQVKTGWEELIGMEAEVRTVLAPRGQVFVQGALWQARTADGTTVPEGDRVVVESIRGLTLTVHRVAQEQAGDGGETARGG